MGYSLVAGRRGIAVAAVAAVVLAVGVGFATSARAHHTICDDEASDYTVNAGGTVWLGADPDHTAPNHRKASVCTTPPQGGHVSVMYTDPNSSTPGGTVGLYTCGLTSSMCGWTANYTGAEVAPATVLEAPSDGDTRTGASAGSGSTCVYVNGVPSCPAGLTIADVTVNEADVAPQVSPNLSPAPPCTGVDNRCVPGATVTVFGDAGAAVAHDTAVTSPGAYDPGRRCVQVNATCAP